MRKKFIVIVALITMSFGLTACTSSSEEISVAAKNGGCELSDYFYVNSMEKVSCFIEDNNLQYDEENRDYYNNDISVYVDEENGIIWKAMSIKNYSIFDVVPGEIFDRDVVSERLNRNGFPLYSDEGNYIFYGFLETDIVAVHLNDDGTVGSVAFDSAGLNDFYEMGESVMESTSMSAIDIYNSIADFIATEDSGFNVNFSESAMTFIANHEELFMGDPTGELSNKYSSTTEFDTKKYEKAPDSYPIAIMWTKAVVTDIHESCFDDGTYLTEGVLDDGTGTYYYFYYPDTIEIYADDEISISGLPLGCGSFDNMGGTTTRCIFLAATYVYNMSDSYGIQGIGN